MSLLSTRFRAGNRPDAPSIPDSCFAEIELKIKKFRGFEKFKLSSAIKADLTDLLQRYSFARYMAGGAINACEAADAIKSLMEGAAGARAAAKEFFGRPHYLLFNSILVRHGMPDLDSFSCQVTMLEGACQCALSQLSLKIRRGKAPDDAFEEWIWGLASLFQREFGKPTSSWSKETKSRYTPFVTFVSKLYALLPAEQAGPSEAALEERVHRALTRRQDQKVKKGS